MTSELDETSKMNAESNVDGSYAYREHHTHTHV